MPLDARLADVRLQLDHPPGVVLGVLRLPLLDPLLDDIESAFDAAGSEAPPNPALVAEIERTVQLLSERMLGMAAEALSRRGRLVELLRRSNAGELPAIAFDDADAFGAELRTMLGTDRPFAWRSATCIRSSSARRPLLRRRAGRPRPAGCSRRRAP